MKTNHQIFDEIIKIENESINMYYNKKLFNLLTSK